MVDVDVTSVVFQLVLPLILYSTWYLILGCSPAIAVQVTIRAGLPEDTVLVRLGGLPPEGTVSEADTYMTTAKLELYKTSSYLVIILVVQRNEVWYYIVSESLCTKFRYFIPNYVCNSEYSVKKTPFLHLLFVVSQYCWPILIHSVMTIHSCGPVVYK